MAEKGNEMILNPEVLEGLNGGVQLDQLNAEERRHYEELLNNVMSEAGVDWKSDKTSEAWKKLESYVGELQKKYG